MDQEFIQEMMRNDLNRVTVKKEELNAASKKSPQDKG